MYQQIFNLCKGIFTNFPFLEVQIQKATLLPRSNNLKGWVADVQLTIINNTKNPIIIKGANLQYCGTTYSLTNGLETYGAAASLYNSTKFPLRVPANDFIKCKLYFQTDFSFDGKLEGKLTLFRKYKNWHKTIHFQNRT